ncbi:hypothetical protein [Dyella sp.]|uniref:hypothetical protein n=1 Tax=Dyella sp. TaxID=1869338 RepID=UPI002ED35E26
MFAGTAIGMAADDGAEVFAEPVDWPRAGLKRALGTMVFAVRLCVGIWPGKDKWSCPMLAADLPDHVLGETSGDISICRGLSPPDVFPASSISCSGCLVLTEYVVWWLFTSFTDGLLLGTTGLVFKACRRAFVYRVQPCKRGYRLILLRSAFMYVGLYMLLSGHDSWSEGLSLK